MNEGWRHTLKLIMLIPVIVFFTMGNRCGGDDPDDVDESPPEVNSYFTPEYDYMECYDVFPNGYWFAVDAFTPGNTDLFVYYDDIISPSENVRYDTLYKLAAHYGEQSVDGLVNKAYIIAIPDALEKPDPDYLGITINSGQPGLTASFIFVQAIKDAYPNDTTRIIEYAVIHELGHSRANLSHLCKETSPGSGVWEVNHDHDDNRCVMSNWPYSLCTLYDVTTNPHFCPADCERLKKVKW